MPRNPSSPLVTFRARLARAVQFLSTATSVLLLSSVAAGLTVGRSALQSRAGTFKQAELRVHFSWPPLGGNGAAAALADGRPNTWLDAESRQRLEQIAYSRLSSNPFDATSVRATQDALMQTGWFASPCRVRREPGGIVTVRGMWRVPAAVVRWDGADRLVGGKGELLSAVYKPGSSGLKVILSPGTNPPPLGEQWLGGDVQAGLALLAYLRSAPAAAQIYAVDVSQFASKKKLLIVTDRGNMITWGGPPGEFNPGQARDEVKRDRLGRLLQETGRIDGNQARIDISLATGF